MEQENLWNISYVSPTNLDADFQTEQPMQGKLQIYYRNNIMNKYEVAAQFKSAAQEQAIIKINNFDDVRKLQVESTYEDSRKTGKPFYVYIVETHQKGKPGKVLEVTAIKKTEEPEKLLDIKRKYCVVIGNDTIMLNASTGEEPITLYNQYNIAAIRRALSLNKSFILNVIHEIKNNNLSTTQGKVMSYRDGSYILWDGWIPSFKRFCVGMPVLLKIIDTPKNVYVDLNREKEESYYHQRNKWISRLSVVALFALIAYQFKNKIYNFGSLLLQ